MPKEEYHMERGKRSMKIIHCADIHLASKLGTNFDKEKAKERNAEIFESFNRMVSYAVSNDVSAIIIAGDLFDTKNPAISYKVNVQKIIKANPDIDFYYLKGNHDEAGLYSVNDTPPLNYKTFKDTWTKYVIAEEALAGEDMAHDEIAKRPKRITISGMELNESNSKKLSLGLELDAQDFNIVTLHGQLSDYKSEGKEEIINLSELKNMNIDYLALGHIHQHRIGTLLPRGLYCYPGCLEGRGFDECEMDEGTAKNVVSIDSSNGFESIAEKRIKRAAGFEQRGHGFVVLNIDEDTLELKEGSPSFVEFAKRRLFEVKTDVSSCEGSMDINNAIEKEIEKIGADSSDILKITLTGDYPLAEDKDEQLILKHFENDYYHVKVKDETRIKVDYNLFANDASLKGELVRLVKADTSLDEDKKSLIIKCALDALNGGKN